jgi:hypothetical protein
MCSISRPSWCEEYSICTIRAPTPSSVSAGTGTPGGEAPGIPATASHQAAETARATTRAAPNRPICATIADIRGSNKQAKNRRSDCPDNKMMQSSRRSLRIRWNMPTTARVGARTTHDWHVRALAPGLRARRGEICLLYRGGAGAGDRADRCGPDPPALLSPQGLEPQPAVEPRRNVEPDYRPAGGRGDRNYDS